MIGAEVSGHVIRVRGCGDSEVPAGIGAPAVHPRGGAQNNAGPTDGYRPPIGESRRRRRHVAVDGLLREAVLQAGALS